MPGILSWAAANENEWYLGVKRDGKPWEPPVPFFPGLNEDLTKTLNGLFLAHTYQSGSPPQLPLMVEQPWDMTMSPRRNVRSQCIFSHRLLATCIDGVRHASSVVHSLRRLPDSWVPDGQTCCGIGQVSQTDTIFCQRAIHLHSE